MSSAVAEVNYQPNGEPYEKNTTQAIAGRYIINVRHMIIPRNRYVGDKGNFKGSGVVRELFPQNQHTCAYHHEGEQCSNIA